MRKITNFAIQGDKTRNQLQSITPTSLSTTNATVRRSQKPMPFFTVTLSDISLSFFDTAKIHFFSIHNAVKTKKKHYLL